MNIYTGGNALHMMAALKETLVITVYKKMKVYKSLPTAYSPKVQGDAGIDYDAVVRNCTRKLL